MSNRISAAAFVPALLLVLGFVPGLSISAQAVSAPSSRVATFCFNDGRIFADGSYVSVNGIPQMCSNMGWQPVIIPPPVLPPNPVNINPGPRF